MTAKVVIVMATYNSAQFLPAQIESIQQQSFGEWSLVVRDDGSTDSTVQIVDEYAAEDPRIRRVVDQRGNLGPAGNFGALLVLSAHADYVLCSDQDDVWAPTHIEELLTEMIRVEGSGPEGCPRMVFSDYRVVDRGGQLVRETSVVAPWLDRCAGLTLTTLLGFNYVWGCTTVMNHALLEEALPIPPAAENHDYWLALVAAACGGLHYLNRSTVDYRKHGCNVTGGVDQGSWSNRAERLKAVLASSEPPLLQHDQQMRALRALLRGSKWILPAESVALDRYVDAMEGGSLARLVRTRKLGVRQRGLPQEILQTLKVLRS